VFGWLATPDLIWDDLTANERRELSHLVAGASPLAKAASG
jgi:hypothetical protein